MYKIIISESALKQLHRLQKSIVRKIQLSVEKLAENPRPSGVKRIKRKRRGFIQNQDWRLPGRLLN